MSRLRPNILLLSLAALTIFACGSDHPPYDPDVAAEGSGEPTNDHVEPDDDSLIVDIDPVIDPPELDEDPPDSAVLLSDYASGQTYLRTVRRDIRRSLTVADHDRTVAGHSRAAIVVEWTLHVLNGDKHALHLVEIEFQTIRMEGTEASDIRERDLPDTSAGDTWRCVHRPSGYLCRDRETDEPRVWPAWLPMSLQPLLPGTRMPAGAAWAHDAGSAGIGGTSPLARMMLNLHIQRVARSEGRVTAWIDVAVDGSQPLEAFGATHEGEITGQGEIVYDAERGFVTAVDLSWTGTALEPIGARNRAAPVDFERTLTESIRYRSARVD